MLPFCAVILILGHVIEQAWSALDALLQRGVTGICTMAL